MLRNSLMTLKVGRKRGDTLKPWSRSLENSLKGFLEGAHETSIEMGMTCFCPYLREPSYACDKMHRN